MSGNYPDLSVKVMNRGQTAANRSKKKPAMMLVSV